MRVDYVPPPLPDDVDMLFKSAVHKGINFDRYVMGSKINTAAFRHYRIIGVRKQYFWLIGLITFPWK